MVWCRELIMAINRALFNMIDPKTDQLIEDRHQRKQILTRHFERDFLVDESSTHLTLSFFQAEFSRVGADSSFFSWNDFNAAKQRLFLFDLDLFSQSYDSFFLYTNINSPQTVLACQVTGW